MPCVHTEEEEEEKDEMKTFKKRPVTFRDVFDPFRDIIRRETPRGKQNRRDSCERGDEMHNRGGGGSNNPAINILITLG